MTLTLDSEKSLKISGINLNRRQTFSIQIYQLHQQNDSNLDQKLFFLQKNVLWASNHRLESRTILDFKKRKTNL